MKYEISQTVRASSVNCEYRHTHAFLQHCSYVSRLEHKDCTRDYSDRLLNRGRRFKMQQ